tara:strand:+ start:1301 stop:2272 length:972 start_codon:yes stop_codon:yes gene_type:complete
MNENLLLKKRISLIRSAFGDVLIDRDGVNVAIPCINKKCSTYNRKHKKKLCLRVDNEFYHCWVCGHKGKGLERFFRIHAPRHHALAVQLFQKTVKEKEAEAVDKIILPENFRLLATVDKMDDPDLKACRNYALQRGLTEKHLWYFRMGAVSSGNFRRRVIIPSFDSEGHLNYFTARAIDDDTRKYVNPKVKRTEIVFNELNVNWKEELTLVEGPFDLIKSTQNSTCLLGSTLSENHVLFQNIAKNQTPVVLALDPDASKKSQEIAALLSSFDVSVKTLDIAPYDDVGEMPVGKLSEMMKQAKEWSSNDRLKALISTIKSGSLL